MVGDEERHAPRLFFPEFLWTLTRMPEYRGVRKPLPDAEAAAKRAF